MFRPERISRSANLDLVVSVELVSAGAHSLHLLISGWVGYDQENGFGWGAFPNLISGEEHGYH